MNEEQLSILKMVEEGTISAQEAAQLLEALEPSKTSDARATPGVSKETSARKARWMRIEVEERDGNRVHIKLPVILIQAALRLGGRLNMNIGGFNGEKLGPDLVEQIEQALEEGKIGMLVDVAEEDGDRVQIFLE